MRGASGARTIVRPLAMGHVFCRGRVPRAAWHPLVFRDGNCLVVIVPPQVRGAVRPAVCADRSSRRCLRTRGDMEREAFTPEVPSMRRARVRMLPDELRE
ncbi:hypothetical protein GCM10010433_49120 [Streptomyces pulveraceus]